MLLKIILTDTKIKWDVVKQRARAPCLVNQFKHLSKEACFDSSGSYSMVPSPQNVLN